MVSLDYVWTCEAFLHLLAFLVNDTQNAQLHTGIPVQDLQDKPGLHVCEKVPHTSLHKACKNLRILQTDSKDHLFL